MNGSLVSWLLTLGILSACLKLPACVAADYAPTPPKEIWKLILHKDKPVGYYHLSEVIPTHDPDRMQVEIESMVGMAFGSSRYKNQRRLISATLDRKNGGVLKFQILKGSRLETMITGRVDGQQLQLTVLRNDSPQISEIPLPKTLYLPDYLNIPRNQIKVGNSLSLSMFNDQTLSVEPLEVTYIETVELKEHGEVIKARMQLGKKTAFNYLRPDGFLVELVEPTSDIRIMECTLDKISRTTLTPYILKQSINCDRLIKHPENLAKVYLRISTPHSDAIPNWFDDKRQMLVEPDNGKVVMVIQKEAQVFSAEIELLELPDPSEVKNEDDLRSLALLIHKRFPQETEQIQAVHQWTHRFFKKSRPSNYQSLAEILKNRGGDCKAHASLAAEIFRILEIQVKHCVGVVYNKKRFGGHTWLKVWDKDHWISFDSSLNQLPILPTYVQFAEGEDPVSLFFDFFTTLQKLGQCEFEILDLHYA